MCNPAETPAKALAKLEHNSSFGGRRKYILGLSAPPARKFYSPIGPFSPIDVFL
jgi:hypothetical protein